MPFSADKNPLSATSIVQMHTEKKKKQHDAYIYYGSHGNRYDKQQWNHDHSKYLRLMVINWNWTFSFCAENFAENALIEFMGEMWRRRNCLYTQTHKETMRFSLLLVYYVWDAIRCDVTVIMIICLFDYILAPVSYWSLTHKIKYKRIYLTHSCIIHFYKLDSNQAHTVTTWTIQIEFLGEIDAAVACNRKSERPSTTSSS